MKKTFEKNLHEVGQEVVKTLDVFIKEENLPEAKLISAMRYATLGQAKRVRAFLSVKAGELLDLPKESLLRIASSIECLHAASLIHDDMPALDNANTRRGQPALHKAYGEDVALIAGDALIALAFEIIASSEVSKIGDIRASMIFILARAFGAQGVCGGQYLDMQTEQGADIARVTRLQRMKTGALIKAAIALPVCLANPVPDVRHALHNYAHDLGLVFQIIDDILDVEGDHLILGKETGQDKKSEKTNFVTLLGLEGARERAKILGEQAKTHLALFGNAGYFLSDLVDYIIERKS